MQKYSFKEHIELKNIVAMEQIEKSDDFVYNYFMQNKSDVLYILEEGKLEAIASPGDVHNFYIGKGKYEFAINRKFTFLDQIDYGRAQKIFEQIPTIHEIPVILNGKFVGIITDNQCKMEAEWKLIRTD